MRQLYDWYEHKTGDEVNSLVGDLLQCGDTYLLTDHPQYPGQLEVWTRVGLIKRPK